ncbi:MAG TPA: NAD(P)/FAD-dependent oxidoreductase [Mycobacterium sp.]|nr:NAD(P)/FAD-dependent oxidoreductase [Mycobacterium sp.]
MTDQYVDVLIVGAGISGIGAAYHIHKQNPHLRYAVLERREQLGGTWDLFRYPGVRSDSDIFTLSFPWEPWPYDDAIADGEHIWNYLTETADKHGIAEHIRFNTYVRSVDWDSTTDTWTVRAEQDGADTTYQCRFLFCATGYYNYDDPYTPDFRGIDDFTGQVVHPQHWPESLDYEGKHVVVIGSGATAISLIPELSQKAGHVTMLQRSPTYLYSSRKVDPLSNVLRKVLPPKAAHWLIKWRFALFYVLTYQFAKKAPGLMKAYLRRTAQKNLPDGFDIDTHFKPRYNPWDQRLCLILDADVYKTIAEGRTEVVTDHIDHFDATGIALKSGRHIDADVVVTATGLQLQALGGITVSIDGEKITPHDRFVYKGHLLEDVPNLAWCIGYTNASWTLRADMTAEAVARLLAYMHSHGYTHAYPHMGEAQMTEKPTFDLQSGYVLRSLDVLPKSGTHRPWNVRHNYLLDSIDHRFDRIEESMVFGRVAEDSAQSA